MSSYTIPNNIKSRFESLGVLAVYLFGSSAENTASSLSDIDIGIVFEDESVIEGNTNTVYNKIYDIITDVFPEKTIDIVFLQLAGLEIAMDALQHGTVLFESSRDKRLDYEEKVMVLYADFKPILSMFDRAIIERISP